LKTLLSCIFSLLVAQKLSSLISKVVGDVVIPREEVIGLMDNLLATYSRIARQVPFQVNYHV
jgi:hypothetical protein